MSTSKSKSSLPSTKEVLCEHVYAIVKSMTPIYATRVTGMFSELSEKELLDLLQDKSKMAARVDLALRAIRRLGNDDSMDMPIDFPMKKNGDLGDELFHKVSDIETELCAQVTGMLLEMDRGMLQALLQDQMKLENAVNHAKLEYLREHHPSTLPTREDLGEELYEVISKRHPQHAERITGMLLDLDVSTIQELLDSPTQLNKHIAQAFQVVNKKS